MNSRSGFLKCLRLGAAYLILVMTATVAMAKTFTEPMSGQLAGLVHNRATQTFASVLTLNNTGSATLRSQIVVVNETGTSAVTLAGTSDGTTNVANLPADKLAPGCIGSGCLRLHRFHRRGLSSDHYKYLNDRCDLCRGHWNRRQAHKRSESSCGVIDPNKLAARAKSGHAMLRSSLGSWVPHPIADDLYPGAILQPEGLSEGDADE
jgi:hypothetical protein